MHRLTLYVSAYLSAELNRTLVGVRMAYHTKIGPYGTQYMVSTTERTSQIEDSHNILGDKDDTNRRFNYVNHFRL